MGTPLKPMEAVGTAPGNMRFWEALSRTDPAHTKQFKRAGGFSGTALKPIWVEQRLTEVFGPAGIGWGTDKPEYQIIQGENREVLVYCTVRGWHGNPGNSVYGVGGDKVVSYIKASEQYNRPERWENDDEAFKKAFTDATMNAFKHVGIGADIHMGLFDDSKYVSAMREEYSEPKPEETAIEPSVSDEQYEDLLATATEVGANLQIFCKLYNIDSLRDIKASNFESAKKALLAKKRKAA